MKNQNFQIDADGSLYALSTDLHSQAQARHKIGHALTNGESRLPLFLFPILSKGVLGRFGEHVHLSELTSPVTFEPLYEGLAYRAGEPSFSPGVYRGSVQTVLCLYAELDLEWEDVL